MKFCKVCLQEFSNEVEKCPNDGNPLIESKDESTLMQDRIIDGRYKILEVIGRGGFGCIYKAYQFSMDRVVAIKILDKPVTGDPNLAKRFVRESKALARLSHPNIITVHESGRTNDGYMFIVMEYLEGAPLDDFIDGEPVPFQIGCDILLQICDALSEAHKKGIIHRDLKPGNVFIEEKAGIGYVAKVLDFGIAKIFSTEDDQLSKFTVTGSIFGTPEYMSPEQALGKAEIDPRSDLYSLGIIMYEMTVGKRPFGGKNPLGTLGMQINEVPKALLEMNASIQIPRSFNQIVMKCLEKDPAKRPQTAQELKETLLLCKNDGSLERPSDDNSQGQPFENEPTVRQQPIILDDIKWKPSGTHQSLGFAGEASPPYLENPAYSSGAYAQLPVSSVVNTPSYPYLPQAAFPNTFNPQGIPSGVVYTSPVYQPPAKSSYKVLFTLLLILTLLGGSSFFIVYTYTGWLDKKDPRKVTDKTATPPVVKKNRSEKMELLISSSPKGAEVYSQNGSQLHGITDLKIHLPAKAQSIALVFKKEGFFDKTESFAITPETKSILALLTQKKPERLSILIKSIPKGAKVYHRETKAHQGTTDFTIIMKRSDKVLPLMFKYPGYKDKEVDLDPQKNLEEIEVKLEEMAGETLPKIRNNPPDKRPVNRPPRSIIDTEI